MRLLIQIVKPKIGSTLMKRTTLETFLIQMEQSPKELMNIHKELRKDPKYYQGDTLLLAQDLYWCTKYDLDRFNVSKKD